MTLSEFIAFSSFAWIGSFTPGPNVAIATTTGVNHGLRAAVPQMIGVPLGFVGMMWAVGFGAAVAIIAYPALAIGLKLAGIAYLLYLAWGLSRSASMSDRSLSQPLSLWQAAMFQMVNPKAWMMLVAATSTYAIGRTDFLSRMGWMSLGFAIPSALSLLTWAWLGASLREWLHVGQRLRMFNLCMGIALALTAGWMLMQ